MGQRYLLGREVVLISSILWGELLKVVIMHLAVGAEFLIYGIMYPIWGLIIIILQLVRFHLDKTFYWRYMMGVTGIANFVIFYYLIQHTISL
jgi:hypothetical protein